MNFEEEEAWQVPEEEEPESLKRKWEQEDLEKSYQGIEKIECPYCAKPIDADSFSCLYCGKRVFKDSGLMGKLFYWITQGPLLIILLIILASFFLLAVF